VGSTKQVGSTKRERENSIEKGRIDRSNDIGDRLEFSKQNQTLFVGFCSAGQSEMHPDSGYGSKQQTLLRRAKEECRMKRAQKIRGFAGSAVIGWRTECPGSEEQEATLNIKGFRAENRHNRK
jgi:hypothetical protein